MTCGPSASGVGMGRLLRPGPGAGGEAPGFVDRHVVRVQPLHGGGAWGRRDVGPSGAGGGGAVTGGWWQPQWGPIGCIELSFRKAKKKHGSVGQQRIGRSGTW